MIHKQDYFRGLASGHRRSELEAWRRFWLLAEGERKRRRRRKG